MTPIDINGTGSIRAFSTGAPGRGGNTGADAWGRVEFYSYFRPPGAPPVINVNYNPTVFTPGTTTPMEPAVTGTTLGAVYYPQQSNTAPFSETNFYNVGLAPAATYVPSTIAYPSYLPDVTNNPLHGFEFYKIPNMQGAYGGTNNSRGNRPYDPQDFGGMPADENATKPNNYVPTAYPTYDFSVNSNPHVLSDGLNEADEMNLYTPNPLLDSPFGPADIEWLYRQQDVDGSSLSSRLSQLAPISLTNPIDGSRRRRLFALDSWETNNYVWAFDNPGNVFPNNNRFGLVPNQSAGFRSLGLSTPSLAHRDKKINLNYPLPVSNDPNEPVRQKWINDTYQLLKYVLPPRATDTPEELAQLSQFVVNIIDFRDPDCTMTHFQNPDVVVGLGSITPVTGPPAVTKYTPAALYLPSAIAARGHHHHAPGPVRNGVQSDRHQRDHGLLVPEQSQERRHLRRYPHAPVLRRARQHAHSGPDLWPDIQRGGHRPGKQQLRPGLDGRRPSQPSRPGHGTVAAVHEHCRRQATVWGPIPLVTTSFSPAPANMQMTALDPTSGSNLAGFFNVIGNALSDRERRDRDRRPRPISPRYPRSLPSCPRSIRPARPPYRRPRRPRRRRVHSR